MAILAYSNLVVAMSAAALCQAWSYIYNVDLGIYPVLVFFLTHAAYTYMHLMDALSHANQEHPVRRFSKRYFRLLFLLGTISAFISVYILIKQQNLILWLIPPALASLAYPKSPIFRIGLRHIPALKTWLIALTWAYVCAFLPLKLGHVQPMQMVLAFGQYTFWALALLVAFDLRDFRYDEPIGNLPQTIGLKNSIRQGWISLLLVEASILADFINDVHGFWMLLARIIPIELSSLALWRVGQEQKPLFISFWVESIPILLPLLLWLMKVIWAN